MKRKRQEDEKNDFFGIPVDEDLEKEFEERKKRKLTPVQDQLHVVVDDQDIVMEEESRDNLKFLDLCKVLDNIEKTSGTEKKMKLLRGFFQGKNIDLYSFIRLVLSKFDKKRYSYALQQKKIAAIYSKAYLFDDNRRKSLYQWKNVKINTQQRGTNFSDYIQHHLSESGWDVPSGESMTIKEVNDWLDELAKCKKDENTRVQKLKKIQNRTSALEHKWLIRIILKDLRMGLEWAIITKLHVNAEELFNSTTDLKFVCDEVQKTHRDPNYKIKSVIKLFTCVKPMFAQAVKGAKLRQLIRDRDYVFEPKFDGERIMIHLDSKNVMYFTRKGTDYTNCYSEQFNKVVNECCGRLKNAILDGEMIIYDKIIDDFKDFGHNRTLGKEENPNENFCFKCFDIIFYNDEDISKRSYRSRRNCLTKNIKEIKNHFEIVKSEKVGSNVKKVEERLNEEVGDGAEGILLKDADSYYCLGSRKEDWIKVKPECKETLDLLILGGYYGTKFNKRQISHFITGIAEKREDLQKDPDKAKFFPLVKIGGGMKKDELLNLQLKLEDHWEKFDRNNIPAYFSGWIPRGGEKYVPDVIIAPKKSAVLEIKHQSIVDSDKYLPLRFTLRFARCNKIREDKEWFEVTDQKEFDTIRLKKISTVEIQKEKRTKKKKGGRKAAGSGGLIASSRRIDISGINVKENIFEGREYVVFDQKTSNREKIVKLIVENGGRTSANINRTTHAIIGENKSVPRVNNWIQICENNRQTAVDFGCKDVIKSQYFFDCVKEKKEIPLRPKYMVYTSDSTLEFFRNEIDEYGDVYSEDLTVDRLKLIMGKMEIDEETRPSSRRIKKINEKFKIELITCFMKNIYVYVDHYRTLNDKRTEMKDSILKIPGLMVMTYGGEISDKVRKSLTHVIVDPKDKSRIGSIFSELGIKNNKTKVVSYEWVEDCCSEKRIVDETKYEVY